MTSFLNPEISRKVDFFLYRYRFLMFYVAIGLMSLVLELVIFNALMRLNLPDIPFRQPALKLVGLAAGVFFAYWMNVRFNFKVPVAKRNRAVLYFVAISIGSAVINFTFNTQLLNMGWSYEEARFVVAGTVFIAAYAFHRRFSFKDYKKVGVAIYANGVEDIKGIYDKIGAFPDFIHVDIVDHTFGIIDLDPKTYRLEVVRAYWAHKDVHVHIMSRTPSRWIRDVAPFVQTIYIHLDIEENIGKMLDLIRSLGRKAGLCLTMSDSEADARPWIGKIDTMMLLTIPIPGKSGQQFDMNALDRIRAINQWSERSRFTLCVDGGVNEKNVGLLNVENVVSGSSVLNNPKPFKQIMRLQTSSNYERL